MYFLLNLSHYVKSYGHLCQILAFFTMPALQIWPCHVTQEANFEKILFFPNSAFNIGKSYKISSRKALYLRSYQPKTSWGPPVLLGLRKRAKSLEEIFSGSKNAIWSILLKYQEIDVQIQAFTDEN